MFRYLVGVFTVFCGLMFFILRVQPWEYLLAFGLGMCYGSFFYEYLNFKWAVAILMTLWLTISILDPVLAAWLDFSLGVNTVKTLGWSLIINGVVFGLFLVGLYVGFHAR